MLFNDDFVESISDAPVLGVSEMFRMLDASLSDDNRDWTAEEIENINETFALICALDEAGIIEFDFAVPELSGRRFDDAASMIQYIRAIQTQTSAEAETLKLERIKARFTNTFKSTFKYEFSSGDVDRIQTLITELRDHISKSKLFADSHQRRLLMRLEKLQAELHKRMSDMDKFWGLIGDAGVVLGKFGNDAKPIVDRVREITGIVWTAQSRAEELPSGTKFPLLPPQSRPPGANDDS